MIAGLILLKRDIIYKRKNCTRGRCYIPLDSDKHIPLFSTYKFDARIVGRVSQDTTVNSRGRQLLHLCISACFAGSDTGRIKIQCLSIVPWCLLQLSNRIHSSTIRYTATIHYSLPLLGSCCRTQPIYLFIYFL